MEINNFVPEVKKTTRENYEKLKGKKNARVFKLYSPGSNFTWENFSTIYQAIPNMF